MNRGHKAVRITVLSSLKKKIEARCKSLIDKLETEKDEIKQLEIQGKIQATSLSIVLEELKDLSNKEWEELAEELFQPTIKQSNQVITELDVLALKQAKDPAEFKKYEQSKRVSARINKRIGDVVNEANLNKKQLERFLVLLVNQILINDIAAIQNNLNFYEFLTAIEIVKRRFGADHNWLVFISLIQLHENIIKKKIIELSGDYKDDEPIRVLSAKLAKLVKEKEKSDISLSLIMSDGIKHARDIMSHEGYRYAVSKQDVQRLYNEINTLEKTLYGEK